MRMMIMMVRMMIMMVVVVEVHWQLSLAMLVVLSRMEITFDDSS
jgi:hypothetical protein